MDEVKQNISTFEDQTSQLKARKTSIETQETVKNREHQDLQSDISNRKRVIERNVLASLTKTIQIT
jgi:phage shock protein A